MISSIRSAITDALKSGQAARVAAVDSPKSTSQAASGTTTVTLLTDRASMSAIGRQLSESALRASQRERSMSQDERVDYGKKQIELISGSAYNAGKSLHDLEKPKTDDPGLVMRAKLATDYVNSSSKGPLVRNPFTGLSQEQLSLIVYDDSGEFTINERQAAWSAISGLNPEGANQSGVVSQDTIAQLERKIRAELSLPGVEDRKQPERVLNLYDILAGMTPPREKTLTPDNPLHTGKFSPRTSAISPPFSPPVAEPKAADASSPAPDPEPVLPDPPVS